MLTESQIRETAVRIVREDLRAIGKYDRREVDDLLCQHHCPPGGGCERHTDDAATEVRAVHSALAQLGEELREALAVKAGQWGLPPQVAEVDD